MDSSKTDLTLPLYASSAVRSIQNVDPNHPFSHSPIQPLGIGVVMIASAVVTLDPNHKNFESTIDQIGDNTAIETGQLTGCKLPITIEAAIPRSLETLTRWVYQLDGIQFIDIVFVSLEDTQSPEAA